MTYDDLLARCARWMNRTDLTATLPACVQNAEARLNRELRVNQMIARATAQVEEAFADVPADFLAPRSMQIGNRPLSFVAPDALLNVRPLSGEAAYYSVLGAELQFAPAPSGAQEAALTYWKRIPALSETVQTNWLLSAHPDVYLYATLAEAAVVTRDAEFQVIAESRFQEAKAQLERASRSTLGDRLTPTPSTVI